MASDLLRDIWSGAESALRRQLGDELYGRWLRSLTVLSVSESEICLGVSNAWVQEWIEARYLREITEVLHNLAGEDVRVRLAIDPELFGRHRAEQRAVMVGDPATLDPATLDPATLDPATLDPATLGPATLGPATLDSSGPSFEMGGAFGTAGAESRLTRAPGPGAGASPRQQELPRLAEFVEGPCNRLALEAAHRILEKPGRLFNPLFIHGPSGVGKSHLVRAIHAELVVPRGEGLATSERLRGRCLSAERFAQHFAASAQDRTLRKFRETYRTFDVLVVEDIQALASKTKSQGELLYTIEALVDAGRQVVVSADRLPQRLTELEPGLVNRLLGGLVARLECPDLATRWKIARRHASRLAVTRDNRIPWGAEKRCGARRWRGSLREDVLEFVAESLPGGVHDLVGAVLRLDVYGRILGRSPTVGESREILAEILSEKRRRVDLESISSTVAEHFGWSVVDLVSRDRRRALAFARQVAMFLSCRYTRLSLREIGKSFGDRDPTTVRFAQRKIAEFIRTPDSPRARDVLAIIDKLEG